jgi:hypothetical protein
VPSLTAHRRFKRYSSLIESHVRTVRQRILRQLHTPTRPDYPPCSVDKILARNPHHRPKAPDRSPAPLVHAYDAEKRDAYLHAYRVFVINFRAGVEGMLAKAKLITDLFPDWAFPPALPFKVAAAQAA